MSEERVIGRYTLYGEIASGGMATVYLGRLTGAVGFSRTVAVKQLSHVLARDPENVSMFVDEARIASRVRHTNVVELLDVVTLDGELFLVMEYVHGESLSRLMRAARDEGVLVPPAIAASILAGALHGLQAAHDAHDERGRPLDLVHRDVSPQNILVGTDGVARVLDFGVAKAAGRLQDATREGQIKGKLAYMAPEQVRGDATRRSDIFAAGVVLWEVLTGRSLFRGDTAEDTLARVLAAPVVPPGEIVGDLPAELDAVAMRALSRDPSARYATALEMAHAIEEAIPCARPAAVGNWTTRFGRAGLERRDAGIARMEEKTAVTIAGAPVSSSRASAKATIAASAPTAAGAPAAAGAAPSTPPSAKSASAPPPPARSRRPLVTAVAAALLGGIAIAAVAIGRSGSGPQEAPSAITPPASAAPVQSSEGETTAAPSTTTPEPDIAPPATASSARPPVPPRKTGPPRAKQCDPPYTLDRNGHRHYKPECLQ